MRGLPQCKGKSIPAHSTPFGKPPQASLSGRLARATCYAEGNQMSRYMLTIARFRFGLAPLRVVGTSLLVMLLSASMALQAQDKSTSPKAGTQPEAASTAVADKSSQPSP